MSFRLDCSSVPQIKSSRAVQQLPLSLFFCLMDPYTAIEIVPIVVLLSHNTATKWLDFLCSITHVAYYF